MGLEIERKFIVVLSEELYALIAPTMVSITQGYLNKDIDRTVRVRVAQGANSSSYLTVKGRNQGAIRNEFEYEIPVEDGLELMCMCDGIIEKNRYSLLHNDLMIEIDEFGGKNGGLCVAEIEFDEADERRHLSESDIKEILPDWIGDEVTDDTRYYNSVLLTNPFTEWKETI